jgi:hypothetical protein
MDGSRDRRQVADAQPRKHPCAMQVADVEPSLTHTDPHTIASSSQDIRRIWRGKADCVFLTNTYYHQSNLQWNLGLTQSLPVHDIWR